MPDFRMARPYWSAMLARRLLSPSSFATWLRLESVRGPSRRLEKINSHDRGLEFFFEPFRIQLR